MPWYVPRLLYVAYDDMGVISMDSLVVRSVSWMFSIGCIGPTAGAPFMAKIK